MEAPDVTDTLSPNSDRIVADDFMLGPREFRVTRAFVIPKDERQDDDSKKYPMFIFLEGEGNRPWRPPVIVRRFVAAAWGTSSANYVGKRIRLYRDPSVRLGKEVKGGVRIESMSDISPAAYKTPIPNGRSKPLQFNIPALTVAVDPGQVAKAVAAISQADDVARLDGIEAHAVKVGIVNEIRDVLNTRRTELATNQSGA